jgi:hypothetical protein
VARIFAPPPAARTAEPRREAEPDPELASRIDRVLGGGRGRAEQPPPPARPALPREALPWGRPGVRDDVKKTLQLTVGGPMAIRIRWLAERHGRSNASIAIGAAAPRLLRDLRARVGEEAARLTCEVPPPVEPVAPDALPTPRPWVGDAAMAAPTTRWNTYVPEPLLLVFVWLAQERRVRGSSPALLVVQTLDEELPGLLGAGDGER